ncbi:unnamed protein product, partial [Polarella glacialis]
REGCTICHTSDVLIGCDGINGSVRKQLLDDTGHASSPLQYLGVLVMLGITGNLPEGSPGADIADGKSALQMSDGKTRLFAMPFDNCQTMWQLSFPMDLDVAQKLSQEGPAALLAEALRRCGAWAPPVPQLLHSTDSSLVSGYPAYDRDVLGPAAFSAAAGSKLATGLPAVTLLGDAAHPMSPFKGQGANQALMDAVVLAKELCLCGAEGPVPALRRYEAEMLQRSGKKVLASRDVSSLLHSELAIGEGDKTRSSFVGKANLERTESLPLNAV